MRAVLNLTMNPQFLNLEKSANGRQLLLLVKRWQRLHRIGMKLDFHYCL
jgi:hypothetical protein